MGKKSECLGGETEERWVRREQHKWTIMERSAERRGEALGLAWSESPVIALTLSRAEV